MLDTEISEPPSTDVAGYPRRLQLLYLQMFASIFVMPIALYYIRSISDQIDLPSELTIIFEGMTIIVTVATIPLSHFMYHKVMKTLKPNASLPERLKKYIGATTLRAATLYEP